MENKIGMALQEGGFVRVYDENGQIVLFFMKNSPLFFYCKKFEFYV